MRRTVTALSIALAVLACAAPARADVLDTYQRLAERGIKPAPLVPDDGAADPDTDRPLDRHRADAPRPRLLGPSRALQPQRPRRDHRGDRRRVPGACAPSSATSGGSASSAPGRCASAGIAAPCSRGGSGRSRGRSCGPRAASSTRSAPAPRGRSRSPTCAPSPAASTASDASWIGSSSDPDSSSGGFAFTTAHTISVRVEFQASCTFPGSTEPTARVGQAQVTLMRRQGNSFAFDIGDTASAPAGHGTAP